MATIDSTTDSLVRKTFINIEEFLQKVASLDIFEALIFNYKLKHGLLDPLAIHFLTCITEFISQLQLLSQEPSESKDFLEAIPITVTEDVNYNSNLDFVRANEPCHQLPLVLSFCGDACLDKPITSCNDVSKIKPEEPCEGGEVGGDVPVHCEASMETSSKAQRTMFRRKKVEKEKVDKRPRKQDLKSEKESLSNSMKKCNKCEHCDRKFPSATKLKAHLPKCLKVMAKIKTEIFICKYCNMNFNTQKLLDSHISRNHPTTDDVNQLSEGVKELQSLPENLPFFCCRLCSTVYKAQMEFEHHYCKDNDSSMDNSTHTSFRLMSEYLITSAECLKLVRKYRCGQCLEEYRSMVRMLYHLPRCTLGPYHCELCSEKYTSRKDLNLHKKRAHRDTKSFFCDECGLTFKLRASLQKHKVNRHESGQGSYPCDQCSRSFTKRIQLTTHRIREHCLERKFLCQMCGNKFSTHGSLMAHLETHAETRRFSCSYCNKKFRQKEKLTYHERIHTGERPHLCQTCGKGFIRKSKLDEHMRRHRGEKVYHCLPCNKAYASSWDLKIHNKKQHPSVSKAASSQTTASDSEENEDDPDDPPPPKEDSFIVSDSASQPPGLTQLDSLETNPSAMTLTSSSDNNSVLAELNRCQSQSNDVSNNNANDASILVQLSPMEPTNQPAVTMADNVVDNNRIVVQLAPSQLQNSNMESNSRVLVQLNQANDPLVQNSASAAATPRILVQLDPAQTQGLLPSSNSAPGSNSRILVQLDPSQQTQGLPPNTILAVTDAIHLAPLVDNINLGGVTTQYIQLTSQPDATATGTTNGMPLHIQLPVSALSQQPSGTTAYELQSMSVQGHTGLVFTSTGFDVNSITY